MSDQLLERVEAYYDLVPRANATTEEVGPLTVFVGTGEWAYYARPRAGSGEPIQGAHVAAVLDRLRELAVPLELEWVGELRPELAAAAVEAGMTVEHRPLLALRRPLAVTDSPGITVRVAAADDAAMAATRAAIGLGFRAGGPEIGAAGVAERDAALVQQSAAMLAFVRGEIESGRVIMAIAENATGPVGGGSASPRGGVAELTGIATLPSARRRGVALAVTAALVGATRACGVEIAFMSAASDDVARIYERAGFERIGTACVASAPD